MLGVQRQKQILAYIADHQSVQVLELSRVFKVSLATVRRDLQEIEDQGSIRRVHGGAIHVDSQTEPPVLHRKATHSDIKRNIGKAAASLVKDGETIIITSGTTTEAMVPFLAPLANLTVITNALNVALQLTRYPHISVAVLGGWLRHSEFSLLGHLTEQALLDLRADKLFYGTFGVSINDGLTGSYLQESQTDRKFVDAANELIVLADHSKFEQAGPIRSVPLTSVTTIITDRGSPQAVLAELTDMGINVIQVKDDA